MISAKTPKLFTTEEMLALPRTGMDYYLIRGELRETTRADSTTCAAQPTSVSSSAVSWPSGTNICRNRGGEVYGGAVNCRVRRDPDTTVGIDVAYVSAELAADPGECPRSSMVHARSWPSRSLSPSNTWEEITDKVVEYLAGGVALVWLIDPVFRTVTVYRPDVRPTLSNEDQEAPDGARLLARLPRPRRPIVRSLSGVSETV